MLQLLAIGNLDVSNQLGIHVTVVKDLDIFIYKTSTLAGEFNVSIFSCLLS